MIERVARAIAGSAYDHPDTEPDQRRAYSDQAKAAIAAMREPTYAMKQAVDNAENDMGVCYAAYEEINWETAWEIAIGAALKETSNAHDR